MEIPEQVSNIIILHLQYLNKEMLPKFCEILYGNELKLEYIPFNKKNYILDVEKHLQRPVEIQPENFILLCLKYTLLKAR
jgi:hypothetical protein